MVERNKNTKPEDDSPSTQRRNDLREADSKESNIPTVSTFFPLERYYAASDKLLEIFETAYTKKSLDEAYIYGIRYSDFVVKGIPKHDYYMSTKFSSRRIESIRRVQGVMSKVENIVKLMDEEEIEKEKRRKALIERQKRERERIQREREAKQLQELQARIAKQKEDYSSSMAAAADGPSSGTTATNNVEESALAKLQRLSQPHQQQPIPPAMPPPPDKRVSFSEDTTFSDASTTNGSASVQQPLPPPLLPPPEGHEDDKSPVAAPPNNGVVAPPPYNQILGQSKNYFGQKRPTEEASSTGSGAVDPALPSYDTVVKKQKPTIKKQQQQQPKRPKAPTHNIRQHIAQCRQLHLQYLQQRKIQISPLKTYQGRVNGSTNGCTVISACVVSRHLESKGGASSDLVQNVIDRDCIPLLRSIRSKLGLTGSALIIPSDVHDHLVDHKWLFQHKFVGAAGGNVTDPNHIGELFKLLQGEPNKTSHLRSAATFFFREHVISIVKFPTSYTDAVYDVIDSLPTCNGGASRTRCSSIQALKVHMEKYTCSKFSDSNCSYIERNRWDDSMADFDPRVFQTFVWADLPKPKE